jgi:UDP-glucose 4-epimerase
VRVLVTGGLGFVGQAVSRDLLDHGHQVVVLTGSGRGDRPMPAGAEVVQADITDRAAVGGVVRGGGFDAVCHLAAVTKVRDSFADPLGYFDVNVSGTLYLLQGLAETRPAGGVPRFVFGSTNAVYGSQDGHLREDSPTLPGNPYAASKLAAEQLVGYQAATGALAAVTLRCAAVAGAVDQLGDADTTRIIPRALAVAGGDGDGHVSINGDGTAVREFVHVLDVAAAYRLALEAAEPGKHRLWNVGSGNGVTVAQVVDTVRRVTGRPVPVEHQPPKDEPHVLMVDSSRIRTELGWQPVHSDLEEIIRDGWAARHCSLAVRTG